MVDNTNIVGGQPAGQIQPAKPPAVSKARPGGSFDAVIREEIGKWQGVKFSSHAMQRLSSRSIRLSAEDRSNIIEAIDRAQSKGAKDSLVVVGKTALVVSVKNRTVVTALDREEMRGNVFTNIDSAVIMDGG